LVNNENNVDGKNRIKFGKWLYKNGVEQEWLENLDLEGLH
jgi:hypothetical protein